MDEKYHFFSLIREGLCFQGVSGGWLNFLPDEKYHFVLYWVEKGGNFAS